MYAVKGCLGSGLHPLHHCFRFFFFFLFLQRKHVILNITDAISPAPYPASEMWRAVESRRKQHLTALLVDFQWLPAERRIEYKIATICYNVIACIALHMSDFIELCIQSRNLRSSDENLLTDVVGVPRTVHLFLRWSFTQEHRLPFSV